MECAQERVGRKDRHTTVVDAVIHRADGTNVAGAVDQFLRRGLPHRGGHGVRVGERMAIAIPRMGQVKVQIRWSVVGSAGAKSVIESDL